MKQLILDESKKKKRKRKNTSSTKFVRGSWFGFFPDWEKDREIFNQNTTYNEPVEGEKADSDILTPGDASGGESSADGSGDASVVASGDGSVASLGDGGMASSSGDGGAGGSTGAGGTGGI